jgi:hypothetical protein
MLPGIAARHLPVASTTVAAAGRTLRGLVRKHMLLTCTYTTGKVYTHQKVFGKEASAFVLKALLVVLVL